MHQLLPSKHQHTHTHKHRTAHSPPSSLHTSSTLSQHTGYTNLNMSAIRTVKAAVRKELQARLSVLTCEEKARQSSEVERRVLAHPLYKDSDRLALYLNMSNEVGTEGILRHALQHGKTCYIPRWVLLFHSF